MRRSHLRAALALTCAKSQYVTKAPYARVARVLLPVTACLALITLTVAMPAAASSASSPSVSQAVSQICLGTPSAKIDFSHAISAGDDLVLVVGGQGYGSSAAVVTGVSDTANGSWKQLANDQSVSMGNQEYLSYAVYEVTNSKAAAAGLPVTVTERQGQSAASAVLLDVTGASAQDHVAFSPSSQASAQDVLSSPTVSPAANDLAVGLFGAYQHGQSFAAGNGWALSGMARNCTAAFAESRTASTGGSLSATADVGTGTNYFGGIVTFADGQAATDPPATTAPPANTAAPVASGTAQQGQTLWASNGSWTNSPSSYGYQWQDCASGSCSNVSGATASSYKLQPSVVGDTVDVVVKATNAGGSGSATSAQTRAVSGAAVSPPVSTAAPVVSGTAQQGQTLSASDGSWTNSPSSYGYQWQDCSSSSCSNVSGATASSYNLQASDVGDTVDVVVKATNAGGSASATSAQTQAVTAVGSGGFSSLHVSGTKLENQGGQPVVFHGVNRAGTEYSCTNGGGFYDGTGSNLAGERTQIGYMADWGINAEMITLNEDCWLGINGVSASVSDSNGAPTPGCSASQCPYANAIENIVATDEADHIYPVISLFALAPGTTKSTGHNTLTDNDHAPLFWEEVADFFKNDPGVTFRLEQEPELWNGSEADWQCWAQGDVSYSTSSDNTPPAAPTSTGSPDMCQSKGLASYQTVGMQSLVNIVRGTGASNIVMLPGLAYANMWSCGASQSPSTCGALASATPAVTDPDSNLMAEADVYPEGNTCGNTSCYNTVYKPVAQAMPFVAGEMGENPANGYYPTTDVDVLMNWLDANGNGYFPYAWDPWAHLIPSYGDNSAPVSGWGTDYYDHINGITPPSPPQPTDGISLPWSLPSDCVSLSNGSLHPTATSPAVNAGDDLFAVFGGQGYNGTASTITGISDNVNGAWTRVASSGAQSLSYGGATFGASYSVFELANSKAAPSGMTVTVNGTAGQSPQVSGVVFDARGVASIGASSFQSTINSPANPETGPTLSSVPAGDLVLGLWGGYSANETITAPSGWNTHPDWWVSSGECAGAAMDWTQPTTSGSVTPSISMVDNSGDNDYYAAAIDLHP